MHVSPRGWLVASLLSIAAVLLPVVADSSTTTLLILTAALVCCWAVRPVGSSPMPLRVVQRRAPGTRALRGGFLQQTRPGVPGRTRARAPGCGR